MKNITKIIADSYSYSEVARKLGFKSISGSTLKKVKDISEGLDVSHFRKNGRRSLPRYQEIEKQCPICKCVFKSKNGGRAKKTTCSHACANAYFRIGPNHGNWKEEVYRTTCFHYHEKRCIICGEFNIVEVHHYDQNKENNKPENLIPLCPTHHKYVHSRFREKVERKIETYRQSWKNQNHGV